MPKRKSPSDDEGDDFEQSEDDQPKNKTKASKATERPVTIKKPKITTSGSQSPSSSKKKSTNDNGVEVFTSSEGERYIQLGQKKRVTVREFKGKILVDIREFYGKDGEEEKPGKKGISLNPDQWASLKKSMDTIDFLFANCKK
ncbi:transcriptional Coactivator p15-domain-containing protein [Suillus paluster]|uniref:transcriptional Coactivator p15-domain-containing protein n=1 Tax=Suillus paluster TaxID=48578 RepID=UPI001B8634D1|nr:transcriptional Coactivator p15-domain-containing protein [Suillus paluster]KAG1732223.1 transcriptional Coactivator p15-domain-containing protein [Suillus paluster]